MKNDFIFEPDSNLIKQAKEMMAAKTAKAVNVRRTAQLTKLAEAAALAKTINANMSTAIANPTPAASVATPPVAKPIKQKAAATVANTLTAPTAVIVATQETQSTEPMEPMEPTETVVGQTVDHVVDHVGDKSFQVAPLAVDFEKLPASVNAWLWFRRTFWLRKILRAILVEALLIAMLGLVSGGLAFSFGIVIFILNFLIIPFFVCDNEVRDNSEVDFDEGHLKIAVQTIKKHGRFPYDIPEWALRKTLAYQTKLNPDIAATLAQNSGNGLVIPYWLEIARVKGIAKREKIQQKMEKIVNKARTRWLGGKTWATASL